MMNSDRLKPRIPTAKSHDPHRDVVENRVREMVAATEKSSSAPVSETGQPTSSVPVLAKVKKTRGKPGVEAKSSDHRRILVDVPTSLENLAALKKLLSGQPDSQQAVIQRRLVANARDLMIADNGRTTWPIKGSESISCRVRLEPAVAQRIYSALEPLGLRSQSSVLGAAMAAHLNGILDRLPR